MLSRKIMKDPSYVLQEENCTPIFVQFRKPLKIKGQEEGPLIP